MRLVELLSLFAACIFPLRNFLPVAQNLLLLLLDELLLPLLKSVSPVANSCEDCHVGGVAAEVCEGNTDGKGKGASNEQPDSTLLYCSC